MRSLYLLTLFLGSLIPAIANSEILKIEITLGVIVNILL